MSESHEIDGERGRGSSSPSRGSERPSGRPTTARSPLWKLGWLVPILLFGLLLYNTFGVTSTRATLGPLSVAVAVTPEPVEAGTALLHVQLSTADGKRPVEEYQVTASIIGGGLAEVTKRTAFLPVTAKAVGGAYEVSFTVPPEGSLEIELQVNGHSPLGSLVYRIEAGKKGAALVRTMPTI